MTKNLFDNPYWKMSAKAMEESQRALTYLSTQLNEEHGSLQAVASDATESYLKYVQEVVKHPWETTKQTADLGKNYFRVVKSALSQVAGREVEPVVEAEKGDFRFSDEGWVENAYFNFIKQAYLVTGRAWLDSINSMPGLDDKTRSRAEFFVRQLVNAASPSNYIPTNPELLSLTIKTRGANLVQGFERFVKDLEKSADTLKITMTDDEAFQLGENIATTKGKVVYRCELFELIQYSPLTDKITETPLLIIPPFVNKFYILDLSEKNSLVRWAVEQGQTVFMVSWLNPTEKERNIGFDRYVTDGALHALEVVEKQTGIREINAAAYCIGGTLLMTTLAYMAARKLKPRVKSATLFTTLTDFSDPGDIGVFIDDHTIKAIEHQNNQKGYFDGRVMAVSFSKLRENSLYWNYYIQNYLKGESPTPFDLLYWNSDSTNITGACHNEMLRKFYMENRLVKPGAYAVNGTKIDLSKIEVPLYFISTHQDHIAKWRVTYEGAKICKDNATFVLGESGHIAGIVNPPAKKKYSYWTNENIVDDADEWLAASEHHKGSWWTHWNDWLQPYKGEEIEARLPEAGKLEVLCDAPGTYVKRKLGVMN
ncbi:class I poly(R)-hydroxyalkanoic acid synthase [Oleiphilus sp. HI0081]|uniref:class I poly(R)-hydroxyalkanoic acid synthase n=4 Tax=Oleiphilus TaxID=141450 RepID=UPI0007C3EAA6|nr:MULTISPECIES: class I poly(R)-hydroxyalkanoic acid synthase [unclassified Oleiphilus]KZY75958.1 class I poly(R)-hydroxyalkanoic acid synthase [Oleiphilus sp. HI0068]KZY78599.1 class I poly(R)-hydroxyalkanoic acid synthase [Oleiphilus sp. HI0069]KZY88551.1 class I poly(R)-hydroxyalkanoic acid synthase [Oleiphilus sp. HI0072]KZZ28333.1 class I poly(R)-hydroxyalkanoic acid synthase [Oleiphilus sp. HI0081]KZY29797.1 class I poly(R)-hydroxyalkanoic acid synthase [Oleiphilus sp. HI0043]